MRESNEIELLYNSSYFPQYSYNGNRFCSEQQVAIGEERNLIYNLVSSAFPKKQGCLFLSKTLLFKCLIYHFINVNQKLSKTRLFTGLSFRALRKCIQYLYPRLENNRLFI